jgi:hypothetical protein
LKQLQHEKAAPKGGRGLTTASRSNSYHAINARLWRGTPGHLQIAIAGSN